MKVSQLSREDLINSLEVMERSENIKKLAPFIRLINDELKSREVTYYELNSDNVISFSSGFNIHDDYLISVERLMVIHAASFVAEHNGVNAISIDASLENSNITSKLSVTDHSIIASLYFKDGSYSNYDLTMFFF